MTSCWPCAFPSPGLTSVPGSIPLGVCRNCNALACDRHGAVDTAKGQYWCSVCLPSLVIQQQGGGGGGGGGPTASAGPAAANRTLLGGDIRTVTQLTARFPEPVAMSRAHAEAVRPVAPVVLRLAQIRWRHLAGEELEVPLDLVPPLVGISLWSAGHEPGDLPAYVPGKEGRQLRRNPLVSGLLYAQRLGISADAAEAWASPQFSDSRLALIADRQVRKEIDLEVSRLEQEPDLRGPQRRTSWLGPDAGASADSSLTRADGRDEDTGQSWLAT